ncbi:MAG: EAL domain-containing protein [Cellvibrionaceae bacterium]|nr:EAL domain-containing protein [Cellvibrionaceae bacterium]
MFNYLSNGFRHWFQQVKLGHRLSIYLMMVCVAFVSITVCCVLFFQYQSDRQRVYSEAEVTLGTIEKQLVQSLWRVDGDGVRLLLQGVQRLPYVNGISVAEPLGTLYTYGDMSSPRVLERDLYFQDEVVGSVTMALNEQLIVDGVIRQAKVITFSSLIIFGLMSFVFSFMVKKTITEHLTKISDAINYAKPVDYENYRPIVLRRRPVNDELTVLVDTLNLGQKKAIDHALARRAYEYQLELQANYDALTNLPNRNHVHKYLVNNIEQLSKQQDDAKLALFFIDLDGFKEVNDSLGHGLGDLILRQSAARFDALIKSCDGYIARFGGDEFIAAIRCASDAQAEAFASALIRTLTESFIIDGNNLQLSCSVGLVYYPDDGDKPDELIRKADIAMYKAKESGRNRYAVFDEAMVENILLSAKLKNKIQDALKDNLFEIYYQPLISLKTKEIIGFEALLRWYDKELGFVSPDVFIPVAEEAGMIFEIDSWVFENAVNQVKQWRLLQNKHFIVSVNFCPADFNHKGLLGWLDRHELFKQNLDWVEVEVTERLMLGDNASVLESLEKMSAIGIKFSIDDFGTGYSSLGYIKKFNHVLSKIKIDRMFVKELMHDESDKALIKSIVTMADSLSIEVLAEGVETPEQEQVLEGLGCDFAQGYYYAKPLPAMEIEKILSRAKPLMGLHSA